MHKHLTAYITTGPSPAATVSALQRQIGHTVTPKEGMAIIIIFLGLLAVAVLVKVL